jgi:hypothetical protein
LAIRNSIASRLWKEPQKKLSTMDEREASLIVHRSGTYLELR